MGYMDKMKDDMKQYGGGSPSADYFEFGKTKKTYRMRLLAFPATLAYHFPVQGRPDVCLGIDEGCKHHGDDAKKPTIRLVTYIIDRTDGKVKRAELPLAINYSINTLQEDSDFAFEDFPMPYDVKINHDPDNTDPKAKYTVIPSPKQEPLTAEEKGELLKAMAKQTPKQFVEMKKKFQNKEVSPRKEEGQEAPPADEFAILDKPIDPEDIPF